MRMVKHLISGVDDRIKQYIDVFTKLRSQFNDHAIVNTEIVVTRILDQVQNIGV